MALAPSQKHTAPGHRGTVTRWLTVVDAKGRLCLQRVVARPGANSAVVHHKVLSDRAVVRKVVRVRELPDSDDARRVVREHVQLEDLLLTLDPASCPKCRQLPCAHLRHGVETLAFLRARQQDRTPVGLSRIDILPDPEEETVLEGRSEDQPYDGGWEPGGIGWFDDRNQPQDRTRIPWDTDSPVIAGPARSPSRFLHDVAGDDTGGTAAVLLQSWSGCFPTRSPTCRASRAGGRTRSSTAWSSPCWRRAPSPPIQGRASMTSPPGSSAGWQWRSATA
jgi:hypothetical protein